MAAKAFILVKVATGRVTEVIKKLGDVKNTLLYGSVPGRYDAIMFVERESHSDLADLALDEVRKIDGVLETRTLFVLRESALRKERMGTRFPVKAALFAKCDPIATTGIMDALKIEPHIAALCAITGEFDIAALICEADAEALAHSVFKIRNLAGVKETETFVITSKMA